MISATAPGKLYLAGEYAVVQPGHLAIVAAVDMTLTVRITGTHTEGSFHSLQFHDYPIGWQRDKEGRFRLKKSQDSFDLATITIQTVEAFVQEKALDLKYYDLEIDSQLNSQAGAKYGLGSSGAVCVALTKALLAFYKIEADLWTVYKLAAISQLRLGKNGSFGDLAASTFGGLLAYSCFDRQVILNKLESSYPLVQLIEEDWPLLEIRELALPDHWQILVGWTGKPASTDDLVDQASLSTSPLALTDFLKASDQAVSKFEQGLLHQDFDLVSQAIAHNRKLLQELAGHKKMVIETPQLKELIEIAQTHKSPAKTSGAGGGDCGYALIAKAPQKEPILRDWQKAGIQPLDLSIYQL